MRTAVILLGLMLVLFSFGCAKPVEQVNEVGPIPQMSQITPPVEDAVVEAVVEPVVEPVSGSDLQPKTIGTRIEGTEQKAVENEVPKDVEFIVLTADKLMSKSYEKLSVGSTLFWKNIDSWPHQLKVTSGSGLDTKLHGESPRLLEGNVWNYTFNERGSFTVRDIFSGKMRMNVTVE